VDLIVIQGFQVVCPKLCYYIFVLYIFGINTIMITAHILYILNSLAVHLLLSICDSVDLIAWSPLLHSYCLLLPQFPWHVPGLLC
jgi:hypothetical protein